jgi:hypothetical protein
MRSELRDLSEAVCSRTCAVPVSASLSNSGEPDGRRCVSGLSGLCAQYKAFGPDGGPRRRASLGPMPQWRTTWQSATPASCVSYWTRHSTASLDKQHKPQLRLLRALGAERGGLRVRATSCLIKKRLASLTGALDREPRLAR